MYMYMYIHACTVHVHLHVFTFFVYCTCTGRKKEMERFVIELQHMTEQTKRKRGAIIISGSGGIGKTKLLRAMKAKASSMGFR